jgi:hypothetical protein
MAESVRPESDQHIGDYLRGQSNFNQTSKALRSLRSLNLVVVKPQRGAADVLELHPLVREFVRRTFPLKERMGFIEGIIAFYSKLIGGQKGKARDERSLEILQYWTEHAELYLAAGNLQAALNCLSDVREAFYQSAAPGEFARVASVVFGEFKWEDHAAYKSFETVFHTYLKILINLGRQGEFVLLFLSYESRFAS